MLKFSQSRWEPTELTFKLKYTFKRVYAGSDYSFLLTNDGRVLAFGNNEYNKLGLNQSTVGFKNADNRKNLYVNFLVIYLSFFLILN